MMLLLGLILCQSTAWAQQDSTKTEEPKTVVPKKLKKKPKGKVKNKLKKGEATKPFQAKKLKETEVNFMFSYYAQNGDNSPVTGGIGTEELKDYTPTVTVNMPLGERSQLKVNAGFDYYTSASTDNIDTRVSSASVKDVRSHLIVDYTRNSKDESLSYGGKLGVSVEYDYTSIQVGGHIAKSSMDNNRTLSLSAQALIDNWTIYYPRELRGTNWLSGSARNSFNVSATYSQVLNKRMQLALTSDVIFQTGLLSTPFHRVYFQEQDDARVEILPDTRIKIPIGLRFNYYLSDQVITRWNYRYYLDDWGINAHTFEVEIPIKLNRFFSIYPFYRYHTQTAADYFAPYKQHSINDEFYSSDYDLASLNSHKFGIGMFYSPVDGIVRIKRPLSKGKTILFKGIDWRYAHYRRSTDLTANIFSIGFSFVW